MNKKNLSWNQKESGLENADRGVDYANNRVIQRIVNQKRTQFHSMRTDLLFYNNEIIVMR